MGLFSDKIFATPIKNLVTLSSWNNSGGNNSMETGRGSVNDRNAIVENNDDDGDQTKYFSLSNTHTILHQSSSNTTMNCQNYFNNSNNSNSNQHTSLYLSCISSSRTPPSPSPPSPQFLPTQHHQPQQQQLHPSQLSPLPLRNILPYTLSSVVHEKSHSPLSTLSSSMSLSSPAPPPPLSDFIQCYSSNNNGKKSKSTSCNSFDIYNDTLQYKNIAMPTSASNYKMHQNQAIKIKSIRRTLNKDDETGKRQNALKAVLTQLQTSLALAKNDISRNDNLISTTTNPKTTKRPTTMEITDITKIKSRGVPFIVNSNEIRNEVSKCNSNNGQHTGGNNSSSFVSTKKNYFMNKTKYCNNSNHFVNDDEESGSASMQQLSTSWEFIKLEQRPLLDTVIKTTTDDQDEQQDVAPPRFIKISDGKISLGPPNSSDNNKEKEVFERRVLELENALRKVQDQLDQSQCGSPTLEKDLKEQLESMNRTIKSKERKAMQVCRDHKTLQARFARQEAILQTLQQENKQLQQRVRQYEHCLDDVMGKIVDALVNEDSLREEVSMLKNRVKDLEAQNAALSASPAKGKDEGYCTMSSGQPQPSNSHLEDLPEEPEQWLLAAEPCSAEMEDWSMSQDELGVITLDDDGNEHEHDWIWNSSYLNSTMIDSQSEGISQLLRETIVYSDDEELTCTDFTRDFYKLVNIPSGSTHSLYSHMDAETDDEDDDEDDNYEDENHSNDDDIELGQINNNLSNENNSNSDKKIICRTTKNKKSGPSPTPSEAGRALVTSCSSSESEGLPTATTNSFIKQCENIIPSYNIDENSSSIINNKTNTCNNKVLKSEVQSSMIPQAAIKLKEIATPSTSYSKTSNSVWRKSNGWKRIATTSPKKEEQPIKKQPSPLKKSKIPPPVPVRRSYAS